MTLAEYDELLTTAPEWPWSDTESPAETTRAILEGGDTVKFLKHARINLLASMFMDEHLSKHTPDDTRRIEWYRNWEAWWQEVWERAKKS